MPLMLRFRSPITPVADIFATLAATADRRQRLLLAPLR